jgi:O-antigen ligase
VNAAAMMSFLVIGLGTAHIALNRLDLGRIPLVKPFAAFLLIALLGVAIAPDLDRALQDWLRTAGAFMLYILVVDLMRTSEDLRWLVRVMIAAATVPLVAGIYQYFTDTGNHETEGFNRIMGTFTHPSPYAFFLVQVLPVAAVFFMHTRSKLARVALVVLIPLMVLSIYATQTRGAWLGLAVVIIVFLWMRARWTLVFVPLVAAALFFALPSVQQRFNEAGSETGSVVWRQRQWTNAIELASPAQLATIGRGLGTVEFELETLAHNEYVRLIVETGALGLLAMFFLYRGLYRITIQGYRASPEGYERDMMLAFLCVFWSRLVIAVSDNVIIFPVLEWYFWSFAAMIVVMSGAYRHSPTPERESEGVPRPLPA